MLALVVQDFLTPVKSTRIMIMQQNPEIVVPGSGISFLKFPVSRHLMKLFYDENTQFFYLLCSQFRQKASVQLSQNEEM
jgi:hypothetical protein